MNFKVQSSDVDTTATAAGGGRTRYDGMAMTLHQALMRPYSGDQAAPAIA
jgi:hypothetical protein